MKGTYKVTELGFLEPIPFHRHAVSCNPGLSGSPDDDEGDDASNDDEGDDEDDDEGDNEDDKEGGNEDSVRSR